MKNHDPQAESARLRTYYAQLPEGELIQLGSQYLSLAESAQTAIRAEFDRRSLPAPELAESDTPEFQPLVTIRQYRDPVDATIAKSALESAGIFCFLRDENTVRMDWGYSVAIGGIRLQVRPEDTTSAEDVLSQSIPLTIEDEASLYEQPRCPFCKSLDVDFEALNPKVGLATILIAVPIPWPRNLWTCRTCGRNWKEVPSGIIPKTL
jgi:hypothetical protein